MKRDVSGFKEPEGREKGKEVMGREKTWMSSVGDLVFPNEDTEVSNHS